MRKGLTCQIPSTAFAIPFYEVVYIPTSSHHPLLALPCIIDPRPTTPRTGNLHRRILDPPTGGLNQNNYIWMYASMGREECRPSGANPRKNAGGNDARRFLLIAINPRYMNVCMYAEMDMYIVLYLSCPRSERLLLRRAEVADFRCMQRVWLLGPWVRGGEF
jgi:hypothetical protein